jgi:hypothetical protein
MPDSPIFVIDLSIWSHTIDKHYEPTTKAKEFMFMLSSHNVSNGCTLGRITPHLQKILEDTYMPRREPFFIEII